MVFFFTSSTPAGTYSLYMGRDKFENEQLIEHGWPEDVWSADSSHTQRSAALVSPSLCYPLLR